MRADYNDFVLTRFASLFSFEIETGFAAGLITLTRDFVAGVGEGVLDIVNGRAELPGLLHIPFADFSRELLNMPPEFVAEFGLLPRQVRKRPAKTFPWHSNHATTANGQGPHREQQRCQSFPGRSGRHSHRPKENTVAATL